MRQVTAAAALLAAAIGLASCAVPTQDAATRLPDQLALPATSATTTPAGTTRSLDVYFLRDGRLTPVREPIPVTTGSLAAVLLALSIGPSAALAKRGYTTAFTDSPAQLSLAGPVSHDGVASVEIDPAFERLLGVPLEEASAQIVYTITGVPDGPKAVRFVSGAAMLASFIPPGEFVDRPVTRSDYCAIAPLGTHCAAAKPSGPTGH